MIVDFLVADKIASAEYEYSEASATTDASVPAKMKGAAVRASMAPSAGVGASKERIRKLKVKGEYQGRCIFAIE